LRNQEAARYARWAAMIAGGIALVVVCVYAARAFRQARALRNAPAAVPVTVEKQSAQFSFSKVEQDRTIFTVRASRATQYRDQDRSLLEDVWITLYGRDGTRNDNIHARKCTYEPSTGDIRCEGQVQIDIASAKPPSGGAAEQTLAVKTSDVSFNRETGEAATSAPVDFSFAGGQGHGVGVSYSTRDSIVRVEHSVEFQMSASERTGGLPVSAAGSSLEIRRGDRTVVLHGPATVREGPRELSADQVSVVLDEDNHARRAIVQGHPQIHTVEGAGKIDVSANQMEVLLSPAGWIERIIADGNVTGVRQMAARIDHFSAEHVEFTMLAARNLLQDMTASGGVAADSQQGGGSRVLKTDALHVVFSPGAGGNQPSAKMDQQQIESVESLAPATIESRSASDTTTLSAQKFVAQMGANQRLEKLFGHAGVEVRRQIGSAAPQAVSAGEMVATFGAGGDWDTLEESGNVRFQQADRQATAAHAKIIRATDLITLDGSPVLSDSMSRTTVASAVINQKSGEIRGVGGVISTYTSSNQNDAVGLGTGAAHISADSLAGSANSGHVTYRGHARLWQGESVLQCDQIELWRDEKKLQATGHVSAIFPQESSPFMPVASKASAPASEQPQGPTLWRIFAPTLTYWSDQGKAHLEGGVSAKSDQGSLDSRTLDVFLKSDGTPAPSGKTQAGGGQLNRVLAEGDVVVTQGGRRGMADQAEYTAADGKFVLSGGLPTITDDSSNTTTGHSLTFYVANDTILVDSQEGSRTLTKHRVEK